MMYSRMFGHVKSGTRTERPWGAYHIPIYYLKYKVSSLNVRKNLAKFDTATLSSDRILRQHQGLACTTFARATRYSANYQNATCRKTNLLDSYFNSRNQVSVRPGGPDHIHCKFVEEPHGSHPHGYTNITILLILCQGRRRVTDHTDFRLVATLFGRLHVPPPSRCRPRRGAVPYLGAATDQPTPKSGAIPQKMPPLQPCAAPWASTHLSNEWTNNL